jgi:hypothetical protein
MTGRTPGMVGILLFDLLPCFIFAKPDFFVPHFASNFLIACYVGTKRAALMIWENCGVERSGTEQFCLLLLLFHFRVTFKNSGDARTAVGGIAV